MEKDMLTFPNRNGRVYNVNKMIDSIKEWAQSNGACVDMTIKDVNYFCQREKNARKYDRRTRYEYVIDNKSMFIDYINLLRP